MRIIWEFLLAERIEPMRRKTAEDEDWKAEGFPGESLKR